MPKPDPWGGVLTSTTPPPPPQTTSTQQKHDPWSPTSQGSSTDLDEFDVITNRNRSSPKTTTTNGTHKSSNDPFELNLLGDALPTSTLSPSTGATKKTPQSFLGENSALVNLDNLVTTSK